MAKFFSEGARKGGRRGEGDAGWKWREWWRIQHVGLRRRDMCYRWVQRSLFAGQRGIDFLSMSAPLFGAQHGGDNSKLIHRWIRINIRAANINSQQKKNKEEMQSVAKPSTQTKGGRKKKALTKIHLESFIWANYFYWLPPLRRCILFDFCINLHNDFL